MIQKLEGSNQLERRDLEKHALCSLLSVVFGHRILARPPRHVRPAYLVSALLIKRMLPVKRMYTHTVSHRHLIPAIGRDRNPAGTSRNSVEYHLHLIKILSHFCVESIYSYMFHVLAKLCARLSQKVKLSQGSTQHEK